MQSGSFQCIALLDKMGFKGELKTIHQQILKGGSEYILQNQNLATALLSQREGEGEWGAKWAATRSCEALRL